VRFKDRSVRDVLTVFKFQSVVSNPMDRKLKVDDLYWLDIRY